MDKELLILAVDLVKVQISMNKMSSEDIESALVKFYNTLQRIERAQREGKSLPLKEAAAQRGAAQRERVNGTDPQGSIQEDKVSCLECGAEFRQLTANHLRTHQISPKEYKRKWGFALKQPLAARVLTKLRSRSAKKRGLPQKLKQYLEAQREKKKLLAAELPGGLKGAAKHSAKRIPA